MGSSTGCKLGWCIAALLLGCASKAPHSKTASQLATENLQRKVSDSQAEVRRLERILALSKPEPELPEPSALDNTESLPVTTLKAPPRKPAPVDEDAAFDERSLVASSEYESMTWYNQGQALMQSGKYDEAVGAFTRFLRMEPEHVYADRAQFHMAECHFRNREFGLALVAFNLVASRYPDSIKVPEAMYQAALSHLKMGQKTAAKNLLHDLLRQFPMDGMATPASKKLAELAGRIPTRF